MRKVINISIYQGEKYLVAEGMNVPIVTQGKTYDELISNLKDAVNLFLEDEDLSKYNLDTNPTIIASLELNNLLYA
jgi:predicted RNase H-like HicB family nuclease